MSALPASFPMRVQAHGPISTRQIHTQTGLWSKVAENWFWGWLAGAMAAKSSFEQQQGDGAAVAPDACRWWWWHKQRGPVFTTNGKSRVLTRQVPWPDFSGGRGCFPNSMSLQPPQGPCELPNTLQLVPFLYKLTQFQVITLTDKRPIQNNALMSCEDQMTS